MVAATLGALLTLATGCPKAVGGSCGWEHWQGSCELHSIDAPTAPNSSGKVIIRARYRVTPAANSATPPAEFVHSIHTTTDEVAGWRGHLEAHPSVSCASARLTRGSCGPWSATFELPTYPARPPAP